MRFAAAPNCPVPERTMALPVLSVTGAAAWQTDVGSNPSVDLPDADAACCVSDVLAAAAFLAGCSPRCLYGIFSWCLLGCRNVCVGSDAA